MVDLSASKELQEPLRPAFAFLIDSIRRNFVGAELLLAGSSRPGMCIGRNPHTLMGDRISVSPRKSVLEVIGHEEGPVS